MKCGNAAWFNLNTNRLQSSGFGFAGSNHKQQVNSTKYTQNGQRGDSSVLTQYGISANIAF